MHHWRMGPSYTPKVQLSFDMLALSTQLVRDTDHKLVATAKACYAGSELNASHGG